MSYMTVVDECAKAGLALQPWAVPQPAPQPWALRLPVPRSWAQLHSQAQVAVAVARAAHPNWGYPTCREPVRSALASPVREPDPQLRQLAQSLVRPVQPLAPSLQRERSLEQPPAQPA